jgi:hypothetical protein
MGRSFVRICGVDNDNVIAIVFHYSTFDYIDLTSQNSCLTLFAIF